MTTNYKELITEISEEVSEGILTPDSTIQILRSTEALMDNYYPIIDWYYEDYEMSLELDTPIKEQYMEDEFSKEEWDELVADQKALKEQYEKDKPSLIEIKVKDALTEMKQIGKLFK